MRKILAAAGIGAALFTGSLVSTGTAHANSGDQDADAYARELYYAQAEDHVISEVSAKKLGDHVCGQRREGYTEADEIRLMETPPPPIATHHQAVVIVLGAEWHFCPSYYVGGESA